MVVLGTVSGRIGLSCEAAWDAVLFCGVVAGRGVLACPVAERFGFVGVRTGLGSKVGLLLIVLRSRSPLRDGVPGVEAADRTAACG